MATRLFRALRNAIILAGVKPARVNRGNDCARESRCNLAILRGKTRWIVDTLRGMRNGEFVGGVSLEISTFVGLIDARVH